MTRDGAHRTIDCRQPKRLMVGVGAALVVVLLVTAWTVASLGSGANGAGWHPYGLRGQFVHSLALSPRGNVMLAGTESGVYVRAPHDTWRLTLPHQEIWSVALSNDGNTALAASNGGNVYVSRDGGKAWRAENLTGNGAYVVSFQPGTSRWMLAGGGGGTFLSRDGGLSWRQESFIGDNAVDALAWQPGSTRTVYAGEVSGGSVGVSSVLESHDGGKTWSADARGLTQAGAMSVLATPHSTLAGTMGRAVWRVRTSGGRWTQVRQGLPPTGDHVAALVASSRGTTLFAGTEGLGVFVSSDDGRTWTARSHGLPSTAGQKIVLGLLYAPAQHTLYAGTPSGIYSLFFR